jgi:hypothetical protein
MAGASGTGEVVARLVALAALCLWWTPGLASATERAAPAPAESAGVRVSTPSPGYEFPSGRRQLQTWAMNALGPSPIAGNLIGASWRQWAIDEPPEWHNDVGGFARRFGAGSLSTGITETSLSLASAVMRQDPVYYRSPRSGVRPRLGHAALMTFMARNPRGNAVFSPAKSLAPFVGPVVTQATVYPDRYDFGTALTSGAYALLISAGWNVVREFVMPTRPWWNEAP